jgi:hypothetical protein
MMRRKKEQSFSTRCTEPARCPVVCDLSVVAPPPSRRVLCCINDVFMGICSVSTVYLMVCLLVSVVFFSVSMVCLWSICGVSKSVSMVCL